MKAIRATTNGFEIAEADLDLRGPGEMLGVQQAGFGELRVADLKLDSRTQANLDRAARELMGEEWMGVLIPPLLARWLGGRADEFAQV